MTVAEIRKGKLLRICVEFVRRCRDAVCLFDKIDGSECD